MKRIYPETADETRELLERNDMLEGCEALRALFDAKLTALFIADEKENDDDERSD